MSLLDFTKHALAITLTLVALATFWAAGSAIAIFLASLALAAALHPQVEYLKRKNFHSAAAAGLVALACLLVCGVLLALMGPSLIADLNLLQGDVTTAIASFSEHSPNHWLVRATRPDVDGEGVSLLPLVSSLLPSLVGTASNLFQLSALGGICLALSFYWTLDRERFERLWLSLVPVRRRVGAQRMWQSMEREVGSYLRSEIIQFLIAVILLWAIFIVLGMRYAALAALVAGTLTLIPWLGTIFASAVVLILSSPKLSDWNAEWVSPQGWIALGAMVLVMLLLEFVIEPKLFQRERYNSLWTALATVAMTAMWGFWGLLFGPMVGYVLQILVRQAYPRLVQEHPQVTNEAGLVEKVNSLEQRFADNESAPPELLSLKQRLMELVEQHRELSRSMPEAG
jgi:predicted PurR-regulated permease PerM